MQLPSRWWDKLFRRPAGDDVEARVKRFKEAFANFGPKVNPSGGQLPDITLARREDRMAGVRSY